MTDASQRRENHRLPRIFRPCFMWVWFVLFIIILVGGIWYDGLARSRGEESFLAPTRAELWRGIELGAAIGIIGIISEVARRLAWWIWRQRVILLCTCGFGASIIVLLGWCAYSSVFLLTPLCAGCLVVALGSRLLEVLFERKPDA